MRIFASVSAVPITGPSGGSGAAVLYAVADDGTLWSAKVQDGKHNEMLWVQCTQLPKGAPKSMSL